MSSLIGFTLTQGQINNPQKAEAAKQRALSYFPHLEQLTLNLGESKLAVWGYAAVEDCIHRMPDGSLLVVIGPQAGSVSWHCIQDQLAHAAQPHDFELPWEGRVILIRISADGKQWTMWNDWLGGIPVYHTTQKGGRIASILEPVVVAAAGWTPNDIFLPGLISILTNGHTIGDWTLYKNMKVILPDSLTEWNEQGYSAWQRFTIQPTHDHFEAGWDDLVDEMHELMGNAIQRVLKTRPSWILPLSSGLDSRLLAAVGADLGINIHTFTWGSPHSEDAEYAPQIARALGLPWKWLDTGTDYLTKYLRQWADLIGSATHFHGMYQMPFLDALKTEPPAPIVSGFLGDTLAGFDTNFQTQYHSPKSRPQQVACDDFMHWTVNELRSLLKMNFGPALEEIACEIDRQRTLQDGPWFQRIRFLTIWGRQRHFTYFQTKLADHWRGADTPYLDRAYARFCLSLPRIALDERNLLSQVLKRYYGKLAVIPGSFATDPVIATGRYLIVRRIRRALPPPLRKGPFREFSLVPLSRDADSVKRGGDRAIWPIRETWQQLAEWLDLDLIEHEYRAALNGNIKSVRKLQSVQTLAYRLMNS